ncbi:hypothetical protein SDJN03_21021, partial [Cucurbita argyrosperma subsp. sororia]
MPSNFCFANSNKNRSSEIRVPATRRKKKSDMIGQRKQRRPETRRLDSVSVLPIDGLFQRKLRLKLQQRVCASGMGGVSCLGA